MVINLIIDDEFDDDFLFDSFDECFSRVICDIEGLRSKAMSLSGKYELETLYMLRKNFKHAAIRFSDKIVER